MIHAKAVEAVHRVPVNEYNGVQSLQLIVEHWELLQLTAKRP